MFDTIKDRLFCPFCGKQCKEDDYQTKDAGCLLASLTINELIEQYPNEATIKIYHTCDYCGKWIVINLEMLHLKLSQKDKPLTNEEFEKWASEQW